MLHVFGGGERVTALYQGTQKLWPEDGNYAMGLRVQLPQPGTLDYLYWLHTQMALNGADAGTPACYLRFAVNGTYYYINRSPDGSPAMQMQGELIQLTNGTRAILADCVGQTLAFEAVVPAKCSASFAGPGDNQGFSHSLLTPWLPGTSLTYCHSKAQKRVCSEASGRVYGMRTGMTYIDVPWHNHPGHWRGESWHTHWGVPGLVPDLTGEALCLEMGAAGSSTILSCYLSYPAFYYVFNLAVKEVY